MKSGRLKETNHVGKVEISVTEDLAKFLLIAYATSVITLTKLGDLIWLKKLITKRGGGRAYIEDGEEDPALRPAAGACGVDDVEPEPVAVARFPADGPAGADGLDGGDPARPPPREHLRERAPGRGPLDLDGGGARPRRGEALEPRGPHPDAAAAPPTRAAGLRRRRRRLPRHHHPDRGGRGLHFAPRRSSSWLTRTTPSDRILARFGVGSLAS